MAVTTSVFPNLNTFRLGPEFCSLFRKLQSTCNTHKRATLTERYPDLCSSLEINPKQICQKDKEKQLFLEQDDIVDKYTFEEFNTHNGANIDFDDKLTRLIYK